MVLAARATRDPDRAHGGGRAPRARESARRAALAPRLPRVRDRRTRRVRSIASSGARSRRRISVPSETRREPASGSRRIVRCSRCSAGWRGRRRSTSSRSRRSASAGRPSSTSPVRATSTPCGLASSRDDYVLLESTDDFGAALAAADLAISRAGGTVWELAAAGTPAILVPYPHATADHQTLNARHFEAGGGAVVVDQSELARVPALVEELLGDPARLARDERGDARRSRSPTRRTSSPTSSSRWQRPAGERLPLDGRRFYFVGIGGAGLSAYANFARALGSGGRRVGRARHDLPRVALRRRSGHRR